MTQSEGQVEILAVGDIFLNRKYPHTAFEHVVEPFEQADLRVGNLEGGISELGEPPDLSGGPSLRSPPESLEAVEAIDFDIVSFANNHAMDYGRTALRDTVELLEERSIRVAGAGADRKEAREVAKKETEDTTIGVVAFDATQATMKLNMQAKEGLPGMNVLGVSPLFPEPHVTHEDLERVDQIVTEAIEIVDILFVFYHYGIPPNQTVTIPQRELSYRAIDAGADAVLGAHPHVLQGIETYKGAPICYSLGNFVFDSVADIFDSVESYDDLFERETAYVKFIAGNASINKMTIHPTYINKNEQPVPLETNSDRYSDIAETIIELSKREETEIIQSDECLEVTL